MLMQISKKFSLLFSVFLLFILLSFAVSAEDSILDTAKVTTIDISNFTATQTVNVLSGPNTSLPVNSYMVDYEDYTDRVDQFYRYQYRSLFKTNQKYYAYRLSFKRNGTCTSSFTNIPWARLSVGSMNELTDKTCVMGSTNNSDFTVWYISNNSVENLYLAMYMLCNDTYRNWYGIAGESSVERFMPTYTFTLNYTCTVEPYYKEDFQKELVSLFGDNNDLLELLLSELEHNSELSSDIIDQINSMQAQLHKDNVDTNILLNETKGLISALCRNTDQVESLLTGILNALNASSEQNVDSMAKDDFQQSLGGGMTDGSNAIGSLPDVDIGFSSGGFSWFQKCFTDIFNTMPELTTLLSTVLMLGFIGFVLGRQLNKE